MYFAIPRDCKVLCVPLSYFMHFSKSSFFQNCTQWHACFLAFFIGVRVFWRFLLVCSNVHYRTQQRAVMYITPRNSMQ